MNLQLGHSKLKSMHAATTTYALATYVPAIIIYMDNNIMFAYAKNVQLSHLDCRYT